MTLIAHTDIKGQRGEPMALQTCHQWYGINGRADSGYRCANCKAEIGRISEASQIECVIQLTPVSWLPLADQVPA